MLAFVAGIQIFCYGQSEDSKARVSALKQDLIELFGMESISAVKTRKSCNCGCDIRKETYRAIASGQKLEIMDFCDSHVFEFFGPDHHTESWFESVRSLVVKHGYIDLVGPPSVKNVRKTTIQLIEGKNELTFLETRLDKKGRFHLKLSVATP